MYASISASASASAAGGMDGIEAALMAQSWTGVDGQYWVSWTVIWVRRSHAFCILASELGACFESESHDTSTGLPVHLIKRSPSTSNESRKNLDPAQLFAWAAGSLHDLLSKTL